MTSSVSTRKINVESKTIINKTETPQEPENTIYKDEGQEKIKKLSIEEKKYIMKLIECGYHYRDIVKKVNAYLKTDKAILQELFSGVRRSTDIMLNMEKM